MLSTIAWDLDDVLLDLMGNWVEYWNDNHPSNKKIKYNNLKTWDMTKNLNCDMSEFWEYMDSFKLDGFYSNIKPYKEVIEWFEKYGNYFNHMIITSTPMNTSHISAEWVFKHYGKWIRNFVVIPSYRKDDNSYIFDSSKAEYLRRTNCVDIFIDDNSINCAEVLNGNKVRVFCSKKPWNNGIPMKQILDGLIGYIK